MSKYKDLTGQKFNRLTAIEYLGNSKWKCKCDCGNITIVDISNLTKGHTKSCGCYKRDYSARGAKYNYRKYSRLFYVWCKMRTRCYSPRDKSYADYGGRGITVCEEWDKSFEAFKNWAYANGYDEKAEIGQCTLDRIDNNGNYEPSNCRWATWTEQANNRRSNHLLTYNGKTQNLTQWAKELGINYGTLSRRVKDYKDNFDLIFYQGDIRNDKRFGTNHH